MVVVGPNVMYLAKPGRYNRSESIHLLIEIVASAMCHRLRPEICIDIQASRQPKVGTQCHATYPLRHPAQQARSVQLYRNKYEKLATKKPLRLRRRGPYFQLPIKMNGAQRTNALTGAAPSNPVAVDASVALLPQKMRSLART